VNGKMKIPEYFAREQMETSQLPRAPASIADAGQGLEAQALTGLGGALGKVGQLLANIEAEKQMGRDSATLAEMKGDMDDFEFAEETAVEDVKVQKIKEFGELEESYSKRWNSKTKELLKNQNERVQEYFNNHIELRQDTARRNYHSRIWRKEESFGQGKGLSLYNKALRKGDLPGAIFALDSHAQYIPPKDVQRLKDIAPQAIIKYKVGAFKNAGEFDSARELASTSNVFTPEELSAVLSNIDTAERAKKTKTAIAQEAYINETHKLTIDAISQDINDLSSIEKLPDELKTYWETKLVDRDKMIKAEKGDPFINVYDPARYNSFRTIMEQDPKNLKESQIIDAVGYGLTLDQGIDLIERHRKLSRKDSPLTAPEARRGVNRISNAFKGGIIKHPDFIEGAIPGSEDEYKSSLLRDQMIDEFEDWLQEKPRPPEEIRQHTVEILKPYEEMEARGFMNQVFHNIFSRESWVFSAQDYREAIASLNKEAQAEWEYVGAGEKRHRFTGGVLADDFIHKWQSPHKILTPEIARIYKKWAHGDLEKAKAMAQKDGWKEPK